MTELLTRPVPAPEQNVTELADELKDLLTGAVDVLEVTAGLEAKGIGDRTAHRYGHPDVFALASRLYESTVRRPAFARPAANPWVPDEPLWRRGGRHVLRGLLFGLPGMGYVAVGSLLGEQAAGLLLTLALVLCWPLGQGLAALAYSRPTPGAARRVLGRGVLACAPAMALVCAALGAALGASPVVVAVACAQSLYLLASTAALVTGAEGWLLLTLLPGMAVTFAGMHVYLLLAGWAVTCLAVVALAYERTRGGTDSGVSWIAMRVAASYAAFGLLAAGLLTFTVVAAYAGYGPPPEATGVATAALSVSMGPAEWVLSTFRARGHELLQAAHSLREFALDVRTTLIDLVTRFLAVLAVLLGVALAVAGPFQGFTRMSACSLLLGGALVVALMLQSCGRTTASLVCCALALAGETAALVVSAAEPAVIQLCGAAALFTVLLTYAVVVLGRATAHR